MKKKITKPDGTVIELEGTAEELAELEKQMAKEELKENKKNRRVLNEEKIQRMIEAEVAKRLLALPNHTTIFLPCTRPHSDEIKVVPAPYIGDPISPYSPGAPWWWGQTWCSNKIQLGDNVGGNMNVGDSVPSVGLGGIVCQAKS